MGSAYTDNNKFEKIGTGEQAGTWGTTTNLNFDMIDRAINGVKTITLTGSSSSLTTSDGALTDGLFKVLQFAGTLSSLHTITISPNDVEKLYFINNNCGASVKFTQGSGGDVTIENAKTAIIFCDGAGGSAKVTKIETGSESFTEDLTVKTGDGALLTLQTSDTTVTDGDVLGALQFQAPDDTDGKTGDADGSKVAASIVAEADNTFAADNNQTDMVPWRRHHRPGDQHRSSRWGPSHLRRAAVCRLDGSDRARPGPRIQLRTGDGRGGLHRRAGGLPA